MIEGPASILFFKRRNFRLLSQPTHDIEKKGIFPVSGNVRFQEIQRGYVEAESATWRHHGCQTMDPLLQWIELPDRSSHQDSVEFTVRLGQGMQPSNPFIAQPAHSGLAHNR